MRQLWLSHSSVLPTYRDKLRWLARRTGDEITLAVPSRWPEAGRSVATRDQDAPLEGYVVRSLPVLLPGRLKWHGYPGFRSEASRLAPDLVHVEEEPYAIASFQAARAARRLGALFGFFTWENLLTDFGPLHNRLRAYVLDTADYALAGNREAIDLLARSGFPRKRTHLIPQYGVDPRLFKPLPASGLRKKLGLGKFTVGYAGRLIPDKGLASLVEAFARLGRRDSTLLFLGGGPMRAELEALAGRRGVLGRTRFVASLPQEAVPEHLNAMDTLVLPSLTGRTWKEQFGRVLIEAQACRVPVVGSDSGAIPEVIGNAGLIFREGDVKGLQAHLTRLGSSPALRRRLGAEGQRRVLRSYTNQRLAEAIALVQRQSWEAGRRPSSSRAARTTFPTGRSSRHS